MTTILIAQLRVDRTEIEGRLELRRSQQTERSLLRAIEVAQRLVGIEPLLLPIKLLEQAFAGLECVERDPAGEPGVAGEKGLSAQHLCPLMGMRHRLIEL